MHTVNISGHLFAHVNGIRNCTCFGNSNPQPYAVEIFDINKSINCKQNDLILKKFGNVFMAKTGLSWNTCDIFDKRIKYATLWYL